jgi:integrase
LRVFFCFEFSRFVVLKRILSGIVYVYLRLCLRLRVRFMAEPRKVAGGWKLEVCVNGIRRSKTLPTKAEVKSWAAMTTVELGKMAAGVSTVLTLNDVFVRYANEVSELKKGARWEIVRLNAFARFTIAGVRLVDLRREHLDVFIAERLRTVKASSVNRELNLISHCLTQARRWRLMTHNPMDDLARPKNPAHRDRRVSAGEIEAILLALNYSDTCEVHQHQQRTAVAFLFAIESAMRAGEICALRAENVDLVRRVAHLPDTKNGHARDVPLSTTAVALLQRVKPWGDNGLVFGMASGTLSTLFKRGVDRTGIKNLTFHDSRHEAITRLAKKLDVLPLARMVGHRDIKQLMTYYNQGADELALLLG